MRSVTPKAAGFRIEVKGRLTGSDDLIITRNEVLTAKNLGDDYHLALVDVSPDGPRLIRCATCFGPSTRQVQMTSESPASR